MIDFLVVVLAYEIVILLTFGAQYRLYRWLWLQVASLPPLLAYVVRRLRARIRLKGGGHAAAPVEPSVALRVSPPQALMVLAEPDKTTKPGGEAPVAQ